MLLDHLFKEENIEADDVFLLGSFYYLTARAAYCKKLENERWWDFLQRGEFDDLTRITQVPKKTLAEGQKNIKDFKTLDRFSLCAEWIEQHHEYFFTACKNFFAAQLYFTLTCYYCAQLFGEAMISRLRGQVISHEVVLRAWSLWSQKAEDKLGSPELKIDVVGHHKQFFIPAQKLYRPAKGIDFFISKGKRKSQIY